MDEPGEAEYREHNRVADEQAHGPPAGVRDNACYDEHRQKAYGRAPASGRALHGSGRDRHEADTEARRDRRGRLSTASTSRRAMRSPCERRWDDGEEDREEHHGCPGRVAVHEKVGVAVDEDEDGLRHGIRPDRGQVDEFGSDTKEARQSFRQRVVEGPRAGCELDRMDDREARARGASRTSRASSPDERPRASRRAGAAPWIVAVGKLDHDLGLETAQPRDDFTQWARFRVIDRWWTSARQSTSSGRPRSTSVARSALLQPIAGDGSERSTTNGRIFRSSSALSAR